MYKMVSLINCDFLTIYLKVAEISLKVDRLQKQIRVAKDKEVITAAELKHLKDELSRLVNIKLSQKVPRN